MGSSFRRSMHVPSYGSMAVWTERNALWHGEAGRSIFQSVRWAMETTIDLREAGKKEPRPAKILVGWKRPEPGEIKINIDVAFNPEQNNGSIGIIVQDHEGALIRAQAIWVEHATSALILEEEAVRVGV